MKTTKTTACLNLFLVFLLCFPPAFCFAHENNDCDQLRDKISQLEKLDISAMSPSLQRIYKESLFTLYGQFSQCLQGEIAIATEMQRAVAGTNAAAGVENKLHALLNEKSANDGKITILGTALGLTVVVPGPTPAGPSRGGPVNAAPSARSSTQPLAPAPTPAAPVVVSVCGPSTPYDGAPPILKDLIAGLATQIVNSGDANFAAQTGPQVTLYAVFDAASDSASKLLHTLTAYQYIGETARIDKQLGASANSNGVVSAIEKPGFARLLGFAIEHGGIAKKNDGTNLTLSTSLYSLYAARSKDTAENYAKAGVLNRVAVAATFAVKDKTDELANVRRQDLTEWSARVRLLGDRSSRAPGFQKFFVEKIRPVISKRLQVLGKSMEFLADDYKKVEGTSRKLGDYEKLEDVVSVDLPIAVSARMACPEYKATTTTDAQKIKMISDVMLGLLKTGVYDAVRTGQFKLTPKEISFVEQEALPNLKKALDQAVLADKELKQKFAETQTGPLATFAYTNHRQANTSDYSETKFLYEQDNGFMGPLKLTGNVGLSFYHHPSPAIKQQKLRDVSAALSFNGSTDSPFTESDNLSKMTFSFVGRYERLFENRRMITRKPDIATVQFLMELPLLRGLSLPFSLSFANATEEQRKKNVKFNFGMRLDTDKLFDLLRGAKANQ